MRPAPVVTSVSVMVGVGLGVDAFDDFGRQHAFVPDSIRCAAARALAGQDRASDSPVAG